MKIILANPRGFCAGVNMAIECLERALEFFGPPLYVYHEIVHNKYVVERFKERGTVFVESLDEVPEGSPLLYSAHGVSPQIREQARSRRLLAIDATCPLVTKVHLEAIKYAREGYTIILIGHEGHDEVIGTMGEAPERMVLVETAEDVERLEVADPEQGRLSHPDDAERRRRQHRHRGTPEEVPADRQPAQGRHLLRDAESPGGGARAGGAGRPGARAGQSRTAPTASGWRRSPISMGVAVAPDRRRLGDPAGLVRGGRDRPDHRRGVGAGGRRPGVHRVPRDQLRRDAWRRLTSGKRTSTSRCPGRCANCSRPGPHASSEQDGED